jgi:hypothetical protein
VTFLYADVDQLQAEAARIGRMIDRLAAQRLRLDAAMAQTVHRRHPVVASALASAEPSVSGLEGGVWRLHLLRERIQANAEQQIHTSTPGTGFVPLRTFAPPPGFPPRTAPVRDAPVGRIGSFLGGWGGFVTQAAGLLGTAASTLFDDGARRVNIGRIANAFTGVGLIGTVIAEFGPHAWRPWGEGLEALGLAGGAATQVIKFAQGGGKTLGKAAPFIGGVVSAVSLGVDVASVGDAEDWTHQRETSMAANALGVAGAALMLVPEPTMVTKVVGGVLIATSVALTIYSEHGAAINQAVGNFVQGSRQVIADAHATASRAASAMKSFVGSGLRRLRPW